MQQELPRYPDEAVRVLDPRFARYVNPFAAVERLAQGLPLGRGSVWFGDGRYLLWSDIPNDRIMRWTEETGSVSVFRAGSNLLANGNTARSSGTPRYGRARRTAHIENRIRRLDHGPRGPLQGKRLNSPNDVIVNPTIQSGSRTRRSACSTTTPAASASRNYAERLPARWANRRTERGRRRYRRAERPGLFARRIDPLRHRVTHQPPPHPRVRRGRLQTTRAQPGADGCRPRHAGWIPGRRRRQFVVRLGPGQARSWTACGSCRRKASRSAILHCRNAAPISASAVRSATGCSWRQAVRCIRYSSTRKGGERIDSRANTPV